MDASDPLRSYAEEKTDRLGRYLFEPIEVHWVLSVEKIRHIADATIVANGVTIKANESTQDMYSAIDMALDKLEKQVRKHKEKIKDHKIPGGARFTEEAQAAEAAEETEETEEAIEAPAAPSAGPRVVQRENLFVKPMSVEEAAMQMELVKNDFLVFTDSSTSNINVIYRRKDGDLGLIEARVK
jgi:putative sigma-54 modulation protein